MADFRVLVALDGSSQSERSLPYLALLKPLGDLKIRLLAVVQTYTEAKGLRGEQGYIDRETKLLTAYLEKAAANLNSSQGVTSVTEIRVGTPEEEILKAAAESSPDLLIITTHGRSGVGRWMIGSVADKVLHNGTLPTLVVGPNTPGQPAFHEIMVPLDGSQMGEQALAVGVRWANALGARLHLVRIVMLPVMPASEMASPYTPELLTALQESAETYLARMKTQTAAETVTRVIVGATAEELSAYAASAGIGLVVMASHARRGVARAIVGSIADRMLQGPAPVLIVRPS